MKIDNEFATYLGPLRSGPARRLLVHHVAKRMGYSRRTVRHLAQTGRLRASKVGKKIWVFDPADVERFGGGYEWSR
jgi:excisionase family DNA binding protein